MAANNRKARKRLKIDATTCKESHLFLSLRGLVFQRDEDRCVYCESPLNPKIRTVDHVRPQSKGGLSTFENLVAACKFCNGIAGNGTFRSLSAKRTYILKMRVQRDSRLIRKLKKRVMELERK